MIDFKRLTLNDAPVIRPYFEAADGRICDYTAACSLMWRDYFNTHYALIDGALVLRVLYLDDRMAFSYPMGGSADNALEALAKHCEKNGLPLVFCMVPREKLAALHMRFGSITYTAKSDWADYMFGRDDLVYLKGKKYNGQRNHINRFKKQYPNSGFAPITAKDLPAIRDFFVNTYMPVSHKDDALFDVENTKTLEVLDNYGQYGMFGGVLRVNGKVVGFSAGERVRDTLYVHIEKADRSYDGSYAMLVNSFAAAFAGTDISYINREEDGGDAGLRASKLSYHPIDIIEKFMVTIGQNG